jgi:hypothetical protein
VWSEHSAKTAARRFHSAQKKMSGVMHLYVSAMDEPEKFSPTLHVAFEEKLPWLKLADGLPTWVGPDYNKAVT